MPFSSLLKVFEGRITRAQWWLGMAVIGAIVSGAMSLGADENIPLLVGALIPSAVLFVPLTIGRLHDRGRAVGTALYVLMAFGFVAKIGNRAMESDARWWSLAIVGGALAALAIIELGFMRGTPGDNPYGPDPLDETGGSKHPAQANS